MFLSFTSVISRLEGPKRFSLAIVGIQSWMKSRGWEDNRRALLQYILTCEQ